MGSLPRLQADPSRPLRADAARNRARIIHPDRKLNVRPRRPRGRAHRHRRPGRRRRGHAAPPISDQNQPDCRGCRAWTAPALLGRRTCLSLRGEPGEVLRERIANLLDDGQANRALKDMLAAEQTTVRAYDPDTADAFATTVAALIRAAHQNGTMNPELHADDIGAILAGRSC